MFPRPQQQQRWLDFSTGHSLSNQQFNSAENSEIPEHTRTYCHMMPARPDYSPRRRSSLSLSTTSTESDAEPETEQHPKRCFQCDRKMQTRQKEQCLLGKPKPMVGSMQESLLKGKTSGVPSTPHKFSAVIATSFSTPKFIVPFEARFYTWRDGSSSPFVGHLDMSSPELRKGKFPGVKVKEQGRIQMVICNSEDSLIRLILMRFDAKRLKEAHKFFVRQSTDDYTLHVNFIRAFGEVYIYGDMKLIFNNHLLLEDEGQERKVIGVPSEANLDYFLDGCIECKPTKENLEKDLQDEMKSLKINTAQVSTTYVHEDTATLYERMGAKRLY